MAKAKRSNPVNRLRRALRKLEEADQVLPVVAEQISAYLKVDQVHICIHSSGEIYSGVFQKKRVSGPESYLTLVDGELRYRSEEVPSSLTLTSTSRSRRKLRFLKALKKSEIASAAILPIMDGGSGELIGWIECYCYKREDSWGARRLAKVDELAQIATRKLAKVDKPEEEGAGAVEVLPVVGAGSNWLAIDLSEQGTIVRFLVSAESGPELTLSEEQLLGRQVEDFFERILIEVYRAEALRAVQQLLAGDGEACQFYAEAEGHDQPLLFQLSKREDQTVRLTVSLVPSGEFYQSRLEEATLRSMRLMEYGNLVMIRTDPELRITEVVGDAEKVLGVSTAALLTDERIWERIIGAREIYRLRRLIRSYQDSPRDIREEIQVSNLVTKEVHWVLLNIVPLWSPSNEFVGWEGFALDITEKKSTEDQLKKTSRRIEALYEVSRALHAKMDPAYVALRGLKALVGATGSDAGFAVFLDRNSSQLEIVAAQGLTQGYLDDVSQLLDEKNLMRFAIAEKRGLLIDNIQNDPRAAVDLARREGLKSTIVMPMMCDDQSGGTQVLGALVLFCRQSRKFSELDLELVTAASNQIGLVVRQAEYYSAEKQQANSLAALYRLSHELSKLFTPKEVAEHAFPIIQEELACKRMWLGVVNPQGTHIEGQGGFGPGVRRGLVDVQIELGLRHDFLDEAMLTKKAVVVEPTDDMECSGLNRLIKRLELKTFVVVPLVSLGQVVGILVVEPTIASSVFLKRKLALLSGMANEMATVILARRFESKMSGADKMRMAGLLASGVAHNFNNLLQAVMGQASLVEMQSSPDSPVGKAAGTIIEASRRGAELVRQLLSMTQESVSDKENVRLNSILEESQEVYRSLLGSKIKLELDLHEELPEVLVNYGQIQQVITNLLINAKEAVQEVKDPCVSVVTKVVQVSSAEIDPELSPGHYIRVDVVDNGIGMSEERMERCFEPFYTSKNVDTSTGIGFEGTGLGLSLGYSIVKQHDGVIVVRSKPGEGSVFSVYIPTAEAVEGEQDTTAVAGENGFGQIERPLEVLILDNLENVNPAVRITLESFGFGSTVVEDEEEGRNWFDENREYASLAIVDVDMLTSTPTEFIENAIAECPGIRVIAATTDINRWYDEISELSGVDLVEKPVGVFEIHTALRKLFYKGKSAASIGEVEEPSIANDREIGFRPRLVK